MSMQDIPTTGKTTVYDGDGKTSIPKDVRDELGIEEGDKIKWMVKDGKIVSQKVGQE